MLLGTVPQEAVLVMFRPLHESDSKGPSTLSLSQSVWKVPANHRHSRSSGRHGSSPSGLFHKCLRFYGTCKKGSVNVSLKGSMRAWGFGFNKFSHRL